MKTIHRVLSAGLWLAVFQSALFVARTSQGAAVSFNVTPAAVSNTFSGNITLQVAGLNAGETVVVQKYLDLNVNGAIDAGDLLAQQFQLTDGQASGFSGHTNINVPGDLDPAIGAIAAQLNFQADMVAQSLVGTYAFKLSSPTARFAPLTNFFTVTNTGYPQSFTGSVRNAGTNVPNAIVVLLAQAANGENNFAGGIAANGSGGYTFRAAPGTYLLAAFQSNYVADFTGPIVTLGNGATVTTNLTVTNATRTISGRLVDAANSTLGLPGVFFTSQGADGKAVISFTDTNGNFTLPVTAERWRLQPQSDALSLLGYLGVSDSMGVDTSTGNVAGITIPMSKATAMFYGSVKNEQGNPLTGVRLFGNDDSNQFESDGRTDIDGNYAVGATAGTWNVQVDFGATSGYANYIFTQGFGSTNVSAGDAVLENFIGKLATNRITGSLKDNHNNPIPQVQINARGDINGTNYSAANGYTAADGSYSIFVANGSWTVGVNCDGDRGLDQAQYQCPGETNLVVGSGVGVANFVALNLHPTLGGPRKTSSTQFQFLLAGIPGRNYTMLYSTNLIAWNTLYTTTAPASSFTFIDPSATNSRRFYRALAAAGPFTLSFRESSFAGNFNGGVTPTVNFPVSLDNYRALFSIGFDVNFPQPFEVLFSGPAGSGLTSAPAEYSDGNGSDQTYGSPAVASPAAAPGGAWTVNYKGANQVLTLPDPQAASRLLIPLPTLSVTGGILQSVSWIYKNAATGANLGAPPAYMASIQLQLDDGFGNRLYSSPILPPGTTNQTLTSTVNVGDIAQFYLVYTDSLGNTYVINFGP